MSEGAAFLVVPPHIPPGPRILATACGGSPLLAGFSVHGGGQQPCLQRRPRVGASSTPPGAEGSRVQLILAVALAPGAGARCPSPWLPWPSLQEGGRVRQAPPSPQELTDSSAPPRAGLALGAGGTGTSPWRWAKGHTGHHGAEVSMWGRLCPSGSFRDIWWSHWQGTLLASSG